MVKRLPRLLLLLALLLSSIAPHSAATGVTDTNPETFRSSSIMFIENAGQWDDAARFQVWGGSAGTMWLAEDAIWLTMVERTPVADSQANRLQRLDPAAFNLRGSDLPPARAVNIKLSFVDANPHPRIEPFDRLDTKVSYFISNDPDQWRPDAPVWGGVRYVDLYPGVDLEITGEGGQTVQRLVTRPGADLSAVRLRVEGADAVAVDGDMLRLSNEAGVLAWPLLKTTGAEGTAAVLPHGVEIFDVAKPFVPPRLNSESVTDNPTDLLYGTYLGGSTYDYGWDLAVDEAGHAYVTGETNSANFPAVRGPGYDSTYNGYTDAFVVKLTTSGTGLFYATFIGGSSNVDLANSIAVDQEGQAYVTGETKSADFPANVGPGFDTSYNGDTDAFVIKLTANGTGLLYATFLGGRSFDYGYGIAVDGGKQTYITGASSSSDFPAAKAPGYDNTLNGSADTFVVKLDTSGQSLVYATFLGGNSIDYGYDVAVDGAGQTYVTGSTWSSDFPAAKGPGYDTTYNDGYSDAFVVKLNAGGTALLYATFLGGSEGESGYGIAVDDVGQAHVTGVTQSADFPAARGPGFDTTFNGRDDAYVAKLNASGTVLLYGTFLGGSGIDDGQGIAVDRAGQVYITGETWSADFPAAIGPGYDTSYNGNVDAYVITISMNGMALLNGTFLGGSGGDDGYGIALDPAGQVYVTGWTGSVDFPTANGPGYDTIHNGSGDAYVVKLVAISTPTYSISGRVTDASGTGIYGVTVWAGSSFSTTTNSQGNYSFTGLPAGTYGITPSRYLYAFSPVLRTVTVPPNATGQNFVQMPVVDLSVNRIEVAQVFADATTNPSDASVPLIAEKDSLVRVFVNVTGISALGGVTARLHIRDAQGVLHTLDETYPPSAIWAHQNPDRRRLQDTINFRPPAEWLRGTTYFWADVDPGNRIPETNEGNNTSSTSFQMTLEKGKKWRIAWTRLGYFDGQSLHLPDPQVTGTGDQRLRTLYPVGKNDVEYFFQPGYTEILGVPFDEEHSVEYIIAANRFWKKVAADYGWAEGGSPDRLYGWIPGSARQPGTICGISDPDWPERSGLGRVAVGADHCDKEIEGDLTTIPAASVLAHEIGHVLSSKGLRHPPNAADNRYCWGNNRKDTGYPVYMGYPLGSIGAYGLDIARNWVLSPNSNYDFMAYCWPTWISPYHYVRLHDEFVENPSSMAGAQASTAITSQLLVSGLVFTPTLQSTLDPFYAFRSATAPDPDTGTAFCVELRGAGQGLLSKRCLDLAFHDIETDESSTVDGFVLAVPYPVGTTQIVLTHLGTPIASRAASPHAPIVRLLTPNGGEKWTGSGTYSVTWTASDLDGDTLHFALSYSTDGGASWIPAGLDITGTQHALDVSMLPGGTSVLLRISATDGVNTTDDISDGAFTVGRKAPQAFILSPEEDAHLFPGAAIWLEGRAFDLEDGTLDDAALRWSSDRDGVLGIGKLLITTLSLGPHIITLTVTDSDGNTQVKTIRLSAGTNVFLPLILKGN